MSKNQHEIGLLVSH